MPHLLHREEICGFKKKYRQCPSPYLDIFLGAITASENSTEWA